ncbi:MAG TPA: ABC transporter permease [Ohtaekwangia sp.]|nr:ABC transporter permease [Ohtaekwangia sp.]
MLLSYLKIAFRNLLRNKIHSTINILGLSIGLTACIFIYQYSAFEMSYEKFYQDYDRIYRISYQKFLDEKQTENIAKSPGALATALLAEVPEVENATRLWPLNKVTITTENSIKFNSYKAFTTDTSFLKMLSPNIIAGSVEGEGILISESIAQKYFNKIDPLNSVLSIHEEDRFETRVIGIFKDLPPNTHLDYDILIIDSKRVSEDSWAWTGFYTYVKLKPNASVLEFRRKMNQLAKNKIASKYNVRVSLTPQPIGSIHLQSDLQEELSANGSYKSLLFLMITGCFILIIAWINYVNLSIAKSAERLKEIGIRKVIGSQKFDLIKQFLLDSSLLNILSMLIAVCLISLLSHSFNQLSGKGLVFNNLLSDTNFWLALLIILVTGIIVTGLYPALIFSKFKPVNALKGVFNNNANSGVPFRKALMVFQFAVTSFLITGTLVIYKQMDFMRKSDLGIDISKIIVVKSPNVLKESWSEKLSTYVIDSAYFNKVKTFNENLSSYNSFSAASISHIPGKELIWGTEGFRREDADPSNVHALYMAGIDYDFFSTFNIRLRAGRNFSEQHQADQLRSAIINEEACKTLGFESPEMAVGKNLIFYDNSEKRIIGVVSNYHQESLKRTIKPTFYQLLPRALDYFAIRIPSGDLPNAISIAKGQWVKVFNDNPFEYFFLDDFFNEQYKEDQKCGDVFTLLTTLSIFIACIGLFGISSHMIMQRTKEIGIRKILGASMMNILRLLSGYYLKIVLISFLLAVPISYLTMNNWLDNFAFKIDLEWWMFIAPLIVILVITVTTISFQSIKTALTNPVKSLRSE